MQKTRPDTETALLSGEGTPSFATILKVTNALGIKLHVQSTQVGWVWVILINLGVSVEKDKTLLRVLLLRLTL